jgi:hypothetical protein
MKTWGNGCIAWHILNLGTRWRWVVSFTPQQQGPPNCWYPTATLHGVTIHKTLTTDFMLHFYSQSVSKWLIPQHTYKEHGSISNDFLIFKFVFKDEMNNGKLTSYLNTMTVPYFLLVPHVRMHDTSFTSRWIEWMLILNLSANMKLITYLTGSSSKETSNI